MRTVRVQDYLVIGFVVGYLFARCCDWIVARNRKEDR
jgi:hypothetical protein